MHMNAVWSNLDVCTLKIHRKFCTPIVELSKSTLKAKETEL